MLVKGKRQTQTNGVKVLTPCILWTLRYQIQGTHGVYLGSLHLIPINCLTQALGLLNSMCDLLHPLGWVVL